MCTVFFSEEKIRTQEKKKLVHVALYAFFARRNNRNWLEIANGINTDVNDILTAPSIAQMQ